MSKHKSTLIASRAKPCLADTLSRKPAAAATTTADAALTGWEVYVGNVKLTIIGPAQHQWFPFPTSYYSGQVGTDAERALAARAVRILNLEHRHNTEATRPLVEAILKRALAEMLRDLNGKI